MPMFRAPMKKSHRLLAILFLIGLVATVMPKKDRPTPAPKPVEKVAKVEAQPSKVEQCFAAGTNMARIFLSNFQNSSEAGLLASDMMEKGCEQQVGDQGGDCVRQCKTAFKVEAKGAVRSLEK